MAHGWLAHLGGAGVHVDSAGTHPKGVHPVAVEVMAEVGVDISKHTSDHVDRYADGEYDAVITVCDSAKEACPVFAGAKRTVHRAFTDPDAEMPVDEQRVLFREIRDEIGAWVRRFLAEERAAAPRPQNG